MSIDEVAASQAQAVARRQRNAARLAEAERGAENPMVRATAVWGNRSSVRVTATITVENVPSGWGRLGTSGYPIRPGWWSRVELGDHRVSQSCRSEDEAWEAAVNALLNLRKQKGTQSASKSQGGPPSGGGTDSG